MSTIESRWARHYDLHIVGEQDDLKYYYFDDNGNKIDLLPIQSKKIKKSNEFTYYDEKGYCSFCGGGNCNGGCFK
jgi:hypothetical protein